MGCMLVVVMIDVVCLPNIKINCYMCPFDIMLIQAVPLLLYKLRANPVVYGILYIQHNFCLVNDSDISQAVGRHLPKV